MTQSGWIFSLTQFYFSLGFALFFLALELGLSWVLVIYRIRAWHSVPALYAYRFWVRIFALCCVLAFAASVPVILNLGVLWPKLMSRVGEVAGPLIGLAVLTAFIFKACFLGVMLYGQRILSDLAHTIVLLMVAIGSTITSYWIMAFLAWQQKPIGAVLYQGYYKVIDWFAVLGGLSPLFFLLFLLTGLLLSLAFMFLVTARQSKIRPSDQGDRSIYLFSTTSVLVILALQALVAGLIGAELLGSQPARLATVLAKWDSASPYGLSLAAGLNPDLAANNWQFLGSAWLTDLFNYLLGLSQQHLASLSLSNIAGLHPPLWFSFISARLAVILVLIAFVCGALVLLRAKRSWFDLDSISAVSRLNLFLLAYVLIILQITGWAHLFIGALPYAVYPTITLRELGLLGALESQLWILILQAMIYVFLACCLVHIVRYNIRYGVIPVSRHRGRA